MHESPNAPIVEILGMLSLYHYFLVSFLPILRMMITLYIYSVHERMKFFNEKTIIYQFEDQQPYKEIL